MQDYRIKLFYNYGSPQYQERLTNAIFGDDLSLEYTKGSDEEYYRKNLSGKITFTGADYDFIMGTALDTKIGFLMEIYDPGNGAWWTYLQGYFYRTDCDINADDKIITVEPTTDDGYEDVLSAMEKEFDLIKMAPRITPVLLDKRPCLQIYAAGDHKISCYLSNMWWEQECNAVDDPTALENTYKFARWNELLSGLVSGTHTPAIPSLFIGNTFPSFSSDVRTRSVTSDNYKLRLIQDVSNRALQVDILTTSNTWLFTGFVSGDAALAFPQTITLSPVSGSGATGECIISLDLLQVWARVICDVEDIGGNPTYELPSEDIVDNNRNYTRVKGIAEDTTIGLTVGANSILSSDPTEWGVYQPSQYYTTPAAIYGETMPVCRNRWDRFSYWISSSPALDALDEEARKPTIIKDAYRLNDVINAILAEAGLSMTLSSQFLRPAAPFNPDDEGYIYIIPKSNLLNTRYTEPAQKAPITLKQIFDMLRAMYRCYWSISAGGSYLVIEHIEWYRRGGRYTGSPSVEADLTAKKTVRNDKYWSYLTDKYSYDKPNMPCRYEFGWMDSVTEPFAGWPMEMLSNFVDQGKIEKIQVSNFTSDVDFLMLNPSQASRDGFAIVKATLENIIDTPISRTSPAGQQAQGFIILQYSSFGAESVSVEYNCRGEGVVYALDQNNNQITQLDSWNAISQGDGISTAWNLPQGTAGISIVIAPSGGSFSLIEFNPEIYRVRYWKWAPQQGLNERVLQNGYQSFMYLQRYYDYDMPCRSYRIGSGQYAQIKLATGVSKNKVQEISFPAKDAEVEPEYTIKTNLGYGKIRKLSINLSSRAAKGTLEYDTE